MHRQHIIWYEFIRSRGVIRYRSPKLLVFHTSNKPICAGSVTAIAPLNAKVGVLPASRSLACKIPVIGAIVDTVLVSRSCTIPLLKLTPVPLSYMPLITDSSGVSLAPVRLTVSVLRASQIAVGCGDGEAVQLAFEPSAKALMAVALGVKLYAPG